MGGFLSGSQLLRRWLPPDFDSQMEFIKEMLDKICSCFSRNPPKKVGLCFRNPCFTSWHEILTERVWLQLLWSGCFFSAFLPGWPWNAHPNPQISASSAAAAGRTQSGEDAQRLTESLRWNGKDLVGRNGTSPSLLHFNLRGPHGAPSQPRGVVPRRLRAKRKYLNLIERDRWIIQPWQEFSSANAIIIS